jgi:hypothetical protein
MSGQQAFGLLKPQQTITFGNDVSVALKEV